MELQEINEKLADINKQCFFARGGVLKALQADYKRLFAMARACKPESYTVPTRTNIITQSAPHKGYALNIWNSIERVDPPLTIEE